MDSFNSKNINLLNRAKITLVNFYLGVKRTMKEIFKSKNGQTSDGEQTRLDKKLVFSLSKSRIPKFKQLKYIRRFLNLKELWIINFCLLVIISSLGFIGTRFYQSHLQVIPVNGGEYTEGLIGVPKYINPLYASFSDVDNDITSLVFSSLFKRDKDGKQLNDLVESYQVSENNTIYTFKIIEGVSWHDGSKLIVDDIIFTFNSLKDRQYQSPLRTSFTGVQIEKIDDTTIQFILTEPYAAFLDLLTFGILPRELWQQIPAETANLAGLNLKPIGSGPYKFKSLIKDEKTGSIRSYNLTINENYYNKKPYINDLTFKFFPGFEEAVASLNEGLIDGISYLPQQIKDSIIAQDSLNYFELNLPQLTALFFNLKTNPALEDKKVRQALATAIDKNVIMAQILNQGARLINSPILPGSFAYSQEIKKYSYNTLEAATMLDKVNWKLVELIDDDITKAEEDLLSEDENTKKQAENKIAVGSGKWRSKNNEFLIIRLVTVDTEENIQIAEVIKEFWLGLNIKTVIEPIPSNQIQTDIIKSRNFNVLLYSIVVGADPDPYAFWHSSQISEGGLNITEFSNKEADALLEDARLTSDINIRKEKYKRFQEIIAEEIPAIFLFSPTYTYIQSKEVKGFTVKNILIPRDRFANINEWYIKTGKKLVWE